MRTILVILLVSMWTLTVSAKSGPAVPDFPAEKVAPNTYVIHGPLGHPNTENLAFINNPAFITTQAGVVVVDPGSSVQTGEMVLRQITKLTKQPVVAVFNTHIHGDHWLGNDAIRQAFPEAKIYAHPLMIEAVRTGAGERWIDLLMQLTEGAIAGTQIVGPTLAITDGQEITIGQMKFRIHHTGKAHTKTDVMIEIPNEDLVFTGDNANNGRIVRMDDGSFPGNLEALDRAASLQRAVCVPGHGKAGDAGVISAYHRYLNTLYQTVSVLYEEDLSDFEMKDKVSAKLSEFHKWVGFDSELGRHISRAYLEVEATAF